MKKISINNTKLSYGINMEGIFWRKHGIITNENIRGSRDEELVANLLSAILVKPRPAGTSNNLNRYYSGDNTVENEIRKLGEEYIIKMFETVFDALRQTFESTGSSFSKLIFKKETKYVNRSFQVFFLAFYDLLVKEGLKILDYTKLAKHLEGIGDNYLTANAEYFKYSKQREDGVEVIEGLMKQFFIKKRENDPALNNGVIKLESLLGGSKTENASYDFKIGIHRMDKDGKFDDECFEKILKTLTAIANGSKDSIGYVVLGVADNRNAAVHHDTYYKSKNISYKDFNVTGVQCEANKYNSHENYVRNIETKIRASKIYPSKYKDQILRNIDYFNYYDKTVLILKIENNGEPVKYGDRFYERQSTSTIEVDRDKEVNVYQRILK